MTNGVNGIGGNPISLGSFYIRQNTEETQEETTQQAVVKPEAKQVDEETVMRFLEANNLRVVPKTVAPFEVDAETEARIAGYMERFEELAALVEKEFGPELAPAVLDLVMDKLIGLM